MSHRLATSLSAMSLVVVVLSACHHGSAQKDRAAATSQYAKAKAALGTGDLDEAVSHCRAAIRKRPKWAKAYNLLAMALRAKFFETGDQGYQTAQVAALKKAIRLAPKWPVAHMNLATALWRLGKTRQACIEFRKALALDPSHPDKGSIDAQCSAGQEDPHGTGSGGQRRPR